MPCISRDMGMETKNASIEISIPRTDQLTVAGIANAGDHMQRRSSSNFNGIQMENRLVMREGGCPTSSAAGPRGSV